MNHDFLSSLRAYFDLHYQEAIHTLYGSSTRLDNACFYALNTPGKRIRPLLTLLACRIFANSYRPCLRPALAIEWVHTYSLVHDDLPCLDNDDLRRGRPTVHRAFDEPTALLVGDTLQSDAFSILSGACLSLESPTYDIGMTVGLLSQAIGSKGMALGQALDMQWTKQADQADQSILLSIHQKKTAALIAAACGLGAICGGATYLETEILKNYGNQIGLAFQIIDDLIDDNFETGKTRGKDLSQGKLTFLSLMSKEEAYEKAQALTHKAIDSLTAHFGKRAIYLIDFTKLLLTRKS